MIRQLYTIGIYAYGAAIRAAALVADKPRRWVRGRQLTTHEAPAALQRLGNAPRIWVHCASLGEFEQGRPVIEALKQQFPAFKIIVTFFSPSGYDVRKNYAVADWVTYMPLDTPHNAQAFVQQLRPAVAIFVKYEFWFHHFAALQAARVPIVMISALFRPSQLFFRPYGKPFLAILQKIHHFFVQDTASKALLAQYDIAQASVVGDTRVDRVAAIAATPTPNDIVAHFVANATQVVICGSTWHPDEAHLLRYLAHRNREEQAVKFIIAPHEIRATHIQQLVSRINEPVINYTAATPATVSHYTILIMDTIGMLSQLYQYGTVAYIGGGFGKGIHNILEPAAFGLPVVFGPRYKKFREAVQLKAMGGAFSIAHDSELKIIFDTLLGDKKAHAHAAEQVLAYIGAQKGATQHIITYLQPLLSA